jgi:2-methylisocitrate lyase-like PEP mutase family enzyme
MYTNFKKLHTQPDLLILGNVWDAQSAKIAQEAGFKALGSSSHAIANAMGYEDGEQITVDELLFVVERIVKAVDIPVSVDFESG